MRHRARISFAALLSIALSAGGGASPIAEIDRAVAKADEYAKTHRGQERTFARCGGTKEETTDWREYKSVQELEADIGRTLLFERAAVMSRAANVLVVRHEISSQDWVLFASYYFLPDGTLAYVASRLSTFHGDVTVLRKLHFDRDGALLRKTQEVLDLQTQEKVDPAARPFLEVETPMYRKTSEPPFAKLLPGAPAIGPQSR